MWIRMDDREFEAALATRKRKRFRSRLLAPPLIWVAMTLFIKFFGMESQYEAGQLEFDWQESAVIGGVLTLMATIGMVVFGRRTIDSGKRFCPSCYAITEARPGDLLLCECGGTPEPLDRWEWRDDAP